ncbi:hypothetical protein V8G54_033482, partial [Vigna mungo]
HKLRTFGCLCFPWLVPYTTSKLLPKSQPCVFLGYSPTQSAYICYNPSSQKYYTSRHVQFVETVFPYSSSQPPTLCQPHPPHNPNLPLALIHELHEPTRPPSPFSPSILTHTETEPTPNRTTMSSSPDLSTGSSVPPAAVEALAVDPP